MHSTGKNWKNSKHSKQPVPEDQTLTKIASNMYTVYEDASFCYDDSIAYDGLFAVDVACNLTCFKGQEIDILARAILNNVQVFINPGYSCEQLLVPINTYNNRVFEAVGVHPCKVNECNETTLSLIKQKIQNPNAVAVGEIGLDYYDMQVDKETQKKWFIEQLNLACELQLPLYLHERNAFHDFITILDKYKGRLPPILIHCFTGRKRELTEYIARGYYISVSTYVCKDGHSSFKKFIGMIPLDRLMIETDSPHLKPSNAPETPTGHNEPVNLKYLIEEMAKIYKISVKELVKKTTYNAITFFKINPQNVMEYYTKLSQPMVHATQEMSKTQDKSVIKEQLIDDWGIIEEGNWNTLAEI